jgi:hypothetical protein
MKLLEAGKSKIKADSILGKGKLACRWLLSHRVLTWWTKKDLVTSVSQYIVNSSRARYDFQLYISAKP